MPQPPVMTMPANNAYTLFDTPIGAVGIAWGARGIVAIQLPEKSKEETAARLRERARGAEVGKPTARVKDAIKRITAHLEGKEIDLDKVELDLDGVPPFHRAVWEAARAVPRGTTLSYGELAKRLGAQVGSGAARAVGQAMAKNRFPIVVPCHRVVAAGGKPGGFSAEGGTKTKAKILLAEGYTLEKPAPLPLFSGASRLPFDWDVAVAVLRKADKKLAKVIDKVPGVRLELAEVASPFEALAQSIVYQQLSGKAAATIFSRVRALYPGPRFPAPEAILATPEEKLRGAGLSASKQLAFKDLAQKAMDGLVPGFAALAEMDEESIIARLTQVRGIGRWTVEMLLIFRLGRPDVLPVDDWGVRKGFARAYGLAEPPTAKELNKAGEKWRPYRTVASWYLWRATEL